MGHATLLGVAAEWNIEFMRQVARAFAQFGKK